MIMKEPGNCKIHRLRIIHLYEADYNLIMGVKWRQLQKSADQSRLLNNGQHGSQSGQEATGLSLLKELQNDIAYVRGNL